MNQSKSESGLKTKNPVLLYSTKTKTGEGQGQAKVTIVSYAKEKNSTTGVTTSNILYLSGKLNNLAALRNNAKMN